MIAITRRIFIKPDRDATTKPSAIRCEHCRVPMIGGRPIFDDCDPRTVSLEDVSAWRRKIEDRISLREAHRCAKIWRAMWKVSAALGYCERDADPSLGVRNRAAKGREAIWTEGEAVRMFKRAWRDGYHGLAACMAVAWSTQLSPGDVRTLRASQLAQNATGAMRACWRRAQRPRYRCPASLH